MDGSINVYKKSRQLKLVDKAVSHVANAHFKVLIIKLVHLHREAYNLSTAIGNDVFTLGLPLAVKKLKT